MAKTFKDLGIAPIEKKFSGDKIKIKKIFNREITVCAYKIEPSKFEGGTGKRLCMQITLDGTQHIVFTGSVFLMDQIQKVPAGDFPFTTTIVEDNDCFLFT